MIGSLAIGTSIMRDLTDREARRLQRIKDTCPLCAGLGYKEITKSNVVEIVDCKCVKKIKDIVDLISVNIPFKYRSWNLTKLDSDFENANKSSINVIRAYIHELDENINRGKGLWMCSTPGLAKSSMIAYILRTALKKGFSPYYGKAADFVTLKFRALNKDEEGKAARKLLTFIKKDVEIIAVEEIEKVYLPGQESMPNTLFYEFISELYDAGVSLLVSSNVPPNEYLGTLPWYIQDRLKHLKIVPLRWGSKSGRTQAKSD